MSAIDVFFKRSREHISVYMLLLCPSVYIFLKKSFNLLYNYESKDSWPEIQLVSYISSVSE